MLTPNKKVDIRKVEEYWNHRPCNIRHSPRKVGTVEYFKEVEDRKYFVEPHIPEFARSLSGRGRRFLRLALASALTRSISPRTEPIIPV